ncbi:MAG: rhomboid family intramembrane serine protease, partial [Ignavibacteria bacterium]
GLLIAFALLFPDRYIYLWFLFPIKAKYLIGFFIILEFLLFNPAGSIARLAHIGGIISGFLFIMIDKNIDAPFKRTLMNLRSGSNRSSFTNPFSDITDRFKKKDANVEDANYYDINDKKEEPVSQEEIDRILDKISQSGYQNLSEKEKKILFEASKKMS